MNKKLICLGALASFLALKTNAQEQTTEQVTELEEVIVTTDSRFKLKKENSGKVVHKISKELIENSASKNVADLINTVSGIEVNGNTSGYGQNLGLFVRGGTTKEVVVLIDGVQVSNPAGVSGGFDLRLLDLNDVESIEIIKGAASTLYGSGASTAVINIKLKEASSNAINTTLGLFAGTNNTQEETDNGLLIQTKANINGKIDGFNYLVNFSLLDTPGISSAESENEEDFANDPFQRLATTVKLGYKFNNKFSISSLGTFNRFDNSYDNGAFTDGINFIEDKSYRVSLSPKYSYKNGSIELNAAYSKYDTDGSETAFPYINEGENYIVDAFAKYKLNNLHLLLGLNYQNNSIDTYSIPWGSTELTQTIYEEEPKTELIDPYFNAVYLSDFGLNVNTGVRLNNHNKYGSHFVYNLNPSFTLKQSKGYLKFLTSYSSAFLAPSVQELYASWGNIDLNPQESITIEGGLEYKLKNILLSAVYFNRSVENIIAYNSATFMMDNFGDATYEGVEFNVDYKILNQLTLQGNYTYTTSEEVIIRRPEHKINLGVNYSGLKATNFGLNFQYVGDRNDTDFRLWPSENVSLSAYSLLDFSVNHKLNDNVQLFFDVTNILNEDYQEVLGFSTLGRNYKLGLQFNF